MEKTFGHLADGREARLYTIESGRVRAEVTSYGASLVSLFVDGVDVCLGCDDVRGYEKNGAFLGAPHTAAAHPGYLRRLHLLPAPRLADGGLSLYRHPSGMAAPYLPQPPPAAPLPPQFAGDRLSLIHI